MIKSFKMIKNLRESLNEIFKVVYFSRLCGTRKCYATLYNELNY